MHTVHCKNIHLRFPTQVSHPRCKIPKGRIFLGLEFPPNVYQISTPYPSNFQWWTAMDTKKLGTEVSFAGAGDKKLNLVRCVPTWARPLLSSTSKQLASEHHQWVTTDVVDKSLRELSSHAAKAFMKPPDRLLPPDPFCHSLNFVVRVGRWLQPGGGWQYHRVRGRVHHWTLSIEEYPNPQERHGTWIKGFAKVKTMWILLGRYSL